jgi:hypothetical protein
MQNSDLLERVYSARILHMIWEFQQRNVIDCAIQVAETFWALNKRQANGALYNVLSLKTFCVRIKACRGLVGLAKASHHSGAATLSPHPRSPPSLSLFLLRAHTHTHNTQFEISAVQALATEPSSSPRVPCQANLYKNTSSKRESAEEGGRQAGCF